MTKAFAIAAAVIAAAGTFAAADAGRSQAGAAARDRPVTFDSVAGAAGLSMRHVNGASPDKYLVETMGSGGLFFDYDSDGWIDLFLVDGGSLADESADARARHRLFRNRGDGTFADATPSSSIVHGDYGMGACAGDVDNDGRTDLYITSYGENALYRNAGKGAFADVTQKAGVALRGLWSTSCAFLDADRDGDLDLFVTNYLDAPKDDNQFCGDPQRRIRVYCHPLNYTGLPNVLLQNDGTGVFTDVSEAAGLTPHVGNGLGVAVGDYDDDGWPDVFVANDAVPNFLFHNEKGRFRETGLLAGVAVARDGKARAGMGTEFADYDGDGRLDLVVTNHEFETHSLFRNDGAGVFTDVTIESGLGPATLPYVGFGVVLFDYDNDAWTDLSIVNGHVIDNTAIFRPGSTHAQRKLLLRNTNGRRLAEVGRTSGSGFANDVVGRTLIAGDVDNDGDLDLVVTANGGSVELLRNSGGERRNSVLVRLAGTRGNRDAIGSRITVTAGGRTLTREVKSGSSYLGQNDLRAHFGLGSARSVDRLDVRWPDGSVETVNGLAANQILTITEGRGLTSRLPLTGRD